jgi:hypothetical protein
MAAILGALFFTAVFAFAAWSLVDTVRPRLGKILFLLRYGPALGAELPPRARVTSRGRPAPAAPVRSLPHRMRAAA